jgi:hypothetical protein
LQYAKFCCPDEDSIVQFTTFLVQNSKFSLSDSLSRNFTPMTLIGNGSVDDDNNNIVSFTDIKFVIEVSGCSRILDQKVIVFNLDKEIASFFKPKFARFWSCTHESRMVDPPA